MAYTPCDLAHVHLHSSYQRAVSAATLPLLDLYSAAGRHAEQPGPAIPLQRGHSCADQLPGERSDLCRATVAHPRLPAHPAAVAHAQRPVDTHRHIYLAHSHTIAHAGDAHGVPNPGHADGIAHARDPHSIAHAGDPHSVTDARDTIADTGDAYRVAHYRAADGDARDAGAQPHHATTIADRTAAQSNVATAHRAAAH